MNKKLLLPFFLLSVISFFTGCNTIEGAGKDIEKGGEEIQEATEDARD